MLVFVFCFFVFLGLVVVVVVVFHYRTREIFPYGTCFSGYRTERVLLDRTGRCFCFYFRMGRLTG